jgi:hypothetical protein
VRVRSCSAACVPAWVPAALLWAALLCWLPVSDGGTNRAHVAALRCRLETAAAMTVLSETVLNAGGDTGSWGAAVERWLMARVPHTALFFLIYCVGGGAAVLALFLLSPER